MVQKRKINKPSSVRRKSTSASSGKSKLGETSLDWITDTTEGETLSLGLAENRQNESAGVSKETKLGVAKQYSPEETGKKTYYSPEKTPVLSNSSAITKGKRVTPAKEEEAQKTIVIEEEKTITEEETPIEIGKTYKITEEKELVPFEKVEKTVSGEKKTIPDEKKISPEYEVKKEEVIQEKKIVREGPSVLIPDDSTAIVKKRKETASKEEVISGEEKTPLEKKKTVAAAAKEEVPPSVKRKWMRMSSIGGALKKGGIKVSGTVAKPFKSDKKIFRKSASAVINVSKQPVRAISAVDRKITKSMKKVVSLIDNGNADKGVLNNIKSADSKITKSAKKLIGSILG